MRGGHLANCPGSVSKLVIAPGADVRTRLTCRLFRFRFRAHLNNPLPHTLSSASIGVLLATLIPLLRLLSLLVLADLLVVQPVRDREGRLERSYGRQQPTCKPRVPGNLVL